jgi:hypothetical protein
VVKAKGRGNWPSRQTAREKGEPRITVKTKNIKSPKEQVKQVMTQ